MKLQIRVDDNGFISDAKFKTFGCGSAIASSSYMTGRVKGLSLDEAEKIKNTDIAKELCLPPVKLHCSSEYFWLWVSPLSHPTCPVLAEDAIRSAIRDYRSKRAQADTTKQAGFIDAAQGAAQAHAPA
jgi:NifU-like protein involved in Fe-S cluster formation